MTDIRFRWVVVVLLAVLILVACAPTSTPRPPTELQLLYLRVQEMTTCEQLNPEMRAAVSRPAIEVVLERMLALNLNCSW